MFDQSLFFPVYSPDRRAPPVVYYTPQQVDINKNIYLGFLPNENYGNNMLLMSFGSNHIIPRKQAWINESNQMNFHSGGMKNYDRLNEESKSIKKGSKIKNYDKGKICWHFLRGYCERGNSCHFKHSMTDAAYQSQKVFLPGLPQNITEVALQNQFSHVGCNVINKAVSLQKSWPRVCLESPEDARKLFDKGGISISGHRLEVRPSHAVAEKQRKRIADITRRSVFLGGLPARVTWKMIRSGLANYGAKVTNLLRVKQGFCPKVTLATVNQAIALVSAGKVEINGSMVDVRPYSPKNSFPSSESRTLE